MKRRRMYVTLPQLSRWAGVDTLRIAHWMSKGSVSWLFNEDGIILVCAESIPDDPAIRSRHLLEAAVV